MPISYLKDRVDHQVRRSELSKLPPIQIRLDNLATWRKIAELTTDDDTLDTFCLVNSQLFVRNKKGKMIFAAMDDVQVSFKYYVEYRIRTAKIEHNGVVVNIQELPSAMSGDGWDVVFDSLRLAGTTYKQDKVTPEGIAQQHARANKLKAAKIIFKIVNNLS